MQPRAPLTSNKVSAAFIKADGARAENNGCPWHDVRAMLRKVGLRPTRQRMELGWLLFSKGDRHLTAEMLFEEASNARVPVSLATVYNTLNQFTDVGLLRQVAVDGSKTYFDTNTSDHHHFFVEGQNALVDIPSTSVSIGDLPQVLDGYEIARVDVVVRLKRKGA
jgi:Fur family transcriptional regulator, iron response regulator